MTRALVAAAAMLAVLAPPASASTRVHQLVVFRDGSARSATPSFAATTAKVGRKRCAVAGATPLAALIRSRIGPLTLKDYGACSKHARDGGGLFVAGIGGDRNKSSDGWVYKAGNVLGTAGAGDPAGPLGRGRLRGGARVTWFWCHVTPKDKGCPHTLVASASGGSGSLTVRVRQFNDFGKGGPAAGATVHAGDATAVTGTDGVARIGSLAARTYSVYAQQPGRIRSFPVRAKVT